MEIHADNHGNANHRDRKGRPNAGLRKQLVKVNTGMRQAGKLTV